MSNEKKPRLALKASLIGVMVCCLVSGFRADRQNLAAGHSPTLTQARISVPVLAKQLDSVNGIVPVYLNCEETVLIVSDTLDKIPCTIRNNSGKGITALVLGKSVSFDNNGTRSTELGYVTIDSFIHPDFQKESRKRNTINDKGEPPFPLAAENYSGVITQVEVHVDYVEFNDQETLGPNKAGERIVLGMRDGAAKYKRWLVKEFEIKGRSVGALVRLIEDNPPVDTDLGIRSASQEQGAVIYRNWLRKTYQTSGLDQVKKYFNP